MIAPAALFATAMGLGTDAFAAALARGGLERRSGVLPAVRVGAVFGISEGLMCLAGWALGRSFAGLVTALDHWLALMVLVVIGGRMIREGLSANGDEDVQQQRRRTLAGTVWTAIGTSIDSAAVGVALALTGESPLVAAFIGGASFAMSTIGYAIGPVAGRRMGRHVEVVGGVVIVLIGAGIFVSHVRADGWF